MKNISVDIYGVWGVNKDDDIFYRKGLSDSNHIGIGWTKIEGKLNNISIGHFGLYGVNKDNDIFTKNN